MLRIGCRVAQGKAGRSQYAATKSALLGLARSSAAELIGAGVTVNLVSPAATQTAMLDDPARRSEPPALPPLGRLIRPLEIAALLGFLLSERLRVFRPCPKGASERPRSRRKAQT